MSVQHRYVALLILGALMTLAISKKTVLNASNVTIVSIDAHQLVVSRTIKGKTEQLHFVLNPDTVRSGNLSIGARITVHYTTQNHENTATSIQSLERFSGAKSATK
jgi:hypothetical protein